MDAGWGDAEETLEVGLGGRLPVEQHVGVDEEHAVGDDRDPDDETVDDAVLRLVSESLSGAPDARDRGGVLLHPTLITRASTTRSDHGT